VIRRKRQGWDSTAAVASAWPLCRERIYEARKARQEFGDAFFDLAMRFGPFLVRECRLRDSREPLDVGGEFADLASEHSEGASEEAEFVFAHAAILSRLSDWFKRRAARLGFGRAPERGGPGS
jgi:hypothetical protein